MGYHSNVYVDRNALGLANELLLPDDLPITQDKTLVVCHTMDCEAMDRILLRDRQGRSCFKEAELRLLEERDWTWLVSPLSGRLRGLYSSRDAAVC